MNPLEAPKNSLDFPILVGLVLNPNKACPQCGKNDLTVTVIVSRSHPEWTECYRCRIGFWYVAPPGPPKPRVVPKQVKP